MDLTLLGRNKSLYLLRNLLTLPWWYVLTTPHPLRRRLSRYRRDHENEFLVNKSSSILTYSVLFVSSPFSFALLHLL